MSIYCTWHWSSSITHCLISGSHHEADENLGLWVIMQQVVGRNYHSSLSNNPEEHSSQSHISLLSAHCFISIQPTTWLQKLLKYNVTAILYFLISEESLQTVQQQIYIIPWLHKNHPLLFTVQFLNFTNIKISWWSRQLSSTKQWIKFLCWQFIWRHWDQQVPV